MPSCHFLDPSIPLMPPNPSAPQIGVGLALVRLAGLHGPARRRGTAGITRVAGITGVAGIARLAGTTGPTPLVGVANGSGEGLDQGPGIAELLATLSLQQLGDGEESPQDQGTRLQEPAPRFPFAAFAPRLRGLLGPQPLSWDPSPSGRPGNPDGPSGRGAGVGLISSPSPPVGLVSSSISIFALLPF